MNRFILGSLLLIGIAQSAFAESLTYPDLVDRLANLESLAILPQKGEQGMQWSSYDRKSRIDPASGKYLEWDANGDGEGIIRKEGGKSVLAEMKGPGCIWRIWSAAPKSGHVRIYLDGEPMPAVDLPFTSYFDGRTKPFVQSAMVHTVARGCNNYTPIPFQKSCKIVADGDWGLYYQFVYSVFPEGTTVPTFKMELAESDLAALARVNRRLSECGPSRAPGAPAAARGKLGTGNAQSQASLTGPSAITCIRVKPSITNPTNALNALRALVLKIRWDGESEPAVWSPVGDFFGSAPGINPYRSLPLGMDPDGWWYCNWFMPFAKSAEISFLNEGTPDASLEYEVFTAPIKANSSSLGRFHAKWHRDVLPTAEPERAIDWTIMKAKGSGRFAGVALHIWNPRGGWWGEGDEKFHVDGEPFPSTIGTGSEDYFGYAWCDPALFQNAFHNQTRNDGNNRGHVSVNRWHIADNVPFHTSFDGYIEKYYPNSRGTLYAAVAYFYLSAEGTDPIGPTPLAQRAGYWTPVETYKVPGVIEAERLKILSKTAGEPQEQDLTGFGENQWSKDTQLWWTGAKPGDHLELGIPVEKAGRYRILARLTKARDYGIFELAIDSKAPVGPVDLYNQHVVPSQIVDLGVHELVQGQHVLSAKVIGSNPSAVKAYMFGIDYIKLEATRD